MVGKVYHPLVLHFGRGRQKPVADGPERVGVVAVVELAGQFSLEIPCVVVVEAARVDAPVLRVGYVGLAQKLDGLAVAVQLGNDVLPILHRYGGAADVVASEPVDVGHAYPLPHGRVHCLDKALVVVVQLVDVAPSVRVYHPPVGVFGEKLRVFGHPSVLDGHMVGHPVEPHLHAAPVGFAYKSLQVVCRAVGRVNLGKVHRGVRAVHLVAPRVDGHEPEYVGPERVEAAQLSPCRGESALGRECSDVHLVDDAVVWRHRLGVVYVKLQCPLPACSSQQRRGEQWNVKCLHAVFIC